MRKIYLLLTIVVAFIMCSCSSSQKLSKNVAPKEYQVETMGVGVEGTYLIKVTDYFKTSDEKVYIDGLKKDAVHCVIYKGIPAGNGSMKQPALMNADTKIEGNEQALNDFFEQKQYLQFIGSVVNSSKSVTRLQGSNEYKISLTMSVNKDDLRKYLTDNGIIKSLNFIF